MKKFISMLLLSSIILSGCGANGGSTITVSGSTSEEEFFNETIKPEFESKNDGFIEYQSIGSSAGIKNAITGTSAFGTSSRNLEGDELNAGLTIDTLAYDGIAVIVNPANKVKDLSTEQLSKIYKGEITNWKEVGGVDKPIQVVSREEGSGTRDAFEEILDMKGGVSKTATISDGNGNVTNTVAANDAAIGYVSFPTLYAAGEKVHGIKYNGVDPTADNVKAKTYKLARPFLMVYKEENLTDKDKEFLKFINDNKLKLAPEAGLVELK